MISRRQVGIFGGFRNGDLTAVVGKDQAVFEGDHVVRIVDQVGAKADLCFDDVTRISADTPRPVGSTPLRKNGLQGPFARGIIGRLVDVGRIRIAGKIFGDAIL